MEILNRIITLLGTKDQKELTDFLKLKKTAFTDWKSGKSNSYRKYLIEIAEFFNVSLDYLVYGKENHTKELTDDEQELLENYGKLTDDDKKETSKRVRELANGIASETNENRQEVFKSVQYTDLKEKEMLMLFRSLSEHEQERLIGRAEVLVEQAKLEESAR